MLLMQELRCSWEAERNYWAFSNERNWGVAMNKQKRPPEHIKAQRKGKILDDYVCAFCGRQLMTNEGHHIIPYSEGGPASPDNIITLCHECHVAYHKGEIDIDIIRF